MRKAILALGMIVFLGGLLAWQGAAIPTLTEQTSGDIPEMTKQQVVATYGKLPLSFELNQGQTDPQVKFLSRGGGYTLFLTPTEAVLALRKAGASPPQHATDAIPMTREPETAESSTPTVLRMKLLGANRDPQVAGLEELPGRSNYFIGNDPKKWRTNVARYRKAKLQNVYPGIDLVYYGTNQRQLEYDFIIAPGADLKAIRLKFEGPDRLEVDAQGDLVLQLLDGEVRFHKPYVYQEASGAQQEIAGGYVLKGNNEVAFEVASYDASRPLIIDPVLVYSTYLGGSGDEFAFGIAVDSSGNAYVTGFTRSPNFPGTAGSPIQPAFGGGFSDAFVAKLNPAGSALLYSTYLGGSDSEGRVSIALDGDGNAYVAGVTASTDFPITPGSFQTSCQLEFGTKGSCVDAFVAKLNPSGSALVYSTYLGGRSSENIVVIAVDAVGNAYVTGQTSSGDFPTVNPLQGPMAGTDCFITKFNSDASALIYSTYFGGSGSEACLDIAVDSSDNVYLTGTTNSADFPTTPGVFSTSFGGAQDAFVTKIDSTGSALVYSTYLGGTGQENLIGSIDCGAIAVDANGNAYLTGCTNSTNFPTVNPFQATCAPDTRGFCRDAFVAKLSPAGSTLLYSTYLGGSSDDFGIGIAVDPGGNAYVTGHTLSPNFPTANPFQAVFGGGSGGLGFGDAFVAKLNPAGSTLLYSSYLGGSGLDRGRGIAVDSFGNAYVTGHTFSPNFPTANPFQAVFGGGSGFLLGDAFVTKIGTAVIEVSIDIKPGSDPNAINPAGKGLTPVAVLTTDTFDATTVSPITFQFGPAGASIAHRSAHLEDVDGDGDLDLVLHFRTQESGILCGDAEASLTGETFDGQPIQGSDSIVTVGCS